MNVLVTGANGFLGSYLCRRLLADGYRVTILCRPNANTAALAGLPLEKRLGDVADGEAVRRAVEGQDTVFHAAAHGAYWGRQKEAQNRTNIDGTRNVVEACLAAGVRRLVHVSSIAAIGIPEAAAPPADENFPFNLEDSPLNYHISKKRAEEIVLDAGARGLDAVIVNPSSIWGRFGRHYRLEEFANKVRQTRLVPYFTGGICPVHVEDVVDGMMRALAAGRAGERYILGGENRSYRAIAEAAARELNLARTFVPVPNVASYLAAAALESVALVSQRKPRITFVTHYCASRFHYYDSTRARRELGYAPRPFDEIMRECVAFLDAGRRGAETAN